jgi:hypothetical protein
MPFYKALELLMTEPGKHHFRRKAWEKSYNYKDIKYVCSIAITIAYICLMKVHNNNDTGYAFYPDAADITANDWYEVEV